MCFMLTLHVRDSQERLPLSMATLLAECFFLESLLASVYGVVRVSGISRSWLVNICLASPSQLREIPETQTTSYMQKKLPERNALLAG